MFHLNKVENGNPKFPDCHISDIHIVIKDSNEHIQTIEVPTNDHICDINKKDLFVISDINFDGYEDIQLKTSKNSYYFWIFNPRIQEFIRNKPLELLTDPYLDFDNEVVISSWSFGCCRSGDSHYKYINNKLTLIREKEIYKAQDNSIHFIVKQLVEGDMVVTDEGNL